MVEPHYVMHGADPVPESSSARSRAGGRAAPELSGAADRAAAAANEGTGRRRPRCRSSERESGRPARSTTCPLRTPTAAVTNLHKLK